MLIRNTNDIKSMYSTINFCHKFAEAHSTSTSWIFTGVEWKVGYMCLPLERNMYLPLERKMYLPVEREIYTAKTEGLKQSRLGYFSCSHKFC